MRLQLPHEIENYILSFILESTPTAILIKRLSQHTRIWDPCTVLKTLVRKNRKRRATKKYKFDVLNNWY